MSIPLKLFWGCRKQRECIFLLRPHHYILKVITQFRNSGPRTNPSMEAPFTGIYILERNGISGWINQRGYIFSQLDGNKMAHHCRRAEMQF